MKTIRALSILLAVGAGAWSAQAAAIEPIPQTPGWRGFVVMGGGYTDLKSNTVAGNNLIDIGQPVIDSVAQRPRSDDTFHPVITGEINYTFGGGWQAFFGTSLEDAVTLDGVTQLGARKDLGSDGGVLQGGFLFSGIPTQVWEDPYAEGVRRRETDRDSTGVRLEWDRILGSAFDVTFSYRDISIDTERSGHSSDLSAAGWSRRPLFSCPGCARWLEQSVHEDHHRGHRVHRGKESGAASVVAACFLRKRSRMPAKVIGDIGLDEVVTVVVTRVHAQLECLARCAARVGEQVGIQLLGEEFVRGALVDQDLTVERPLCYQYRRVVFQPG